MQIHDQKFYVLGQTDFDQMVKNRLAVLESALAGTMLEIEEIDAVVEMYRVDPKQQEAFTAAHAKRFELGAQSIELAVRISAILSLTGEFSEPKGE